MTTQAPEATTQNVRPFEMDFDIATIKHLGLQMYSTLPPVIGELVANAWDANASANSPPSASPIETHR